MPRGRPRKDENNPRQHFGARIKQDNLEWLTQERQRTGKSYGELVDQAIESLRNQGLEEE